MKISELAVTLGLEILAMPSPDAEVTGGYTCDLLSWVMGRAESGQAWVTIMTNINIVAVALLTGVGAIVIAEGAEVPESVIKKADEEGINLLSCRESAFAVSVGISRALGI